MDSLAAFIRDHFLRLEEIEQKPTTGPDFDVAKHITETRTLTLERRERALKALRREIEARGVSLPRFFQPFDGAVILRDGEPFWGRFWIEGNYYADESSCDRARYVAIGRAHGDALREDAYRLRRAVEIAHREALVEDVERDALVRALRASVVVTRPRYEVTELGREEAFGGSAA